MWLIYSKKDRFMNKQNNVYDNENIKLATDKNDQTDFNEDLIILNGKIYKEILEYINKNPEPEYNIFKEEAGIELISLFRREVPTKKKYFKRLAKEFRLVIAKKFGKVFFQVQEILDLAGNIPHIIRGSAGSSLICWLMKITNIDPIKERICLARFLHQNRQDYPDIEIDFPYNHREEIFKKVTDRWGQKVARISNHVMYKPKSAMREAIRQEGHNKFIPRDYELADIFEDDEVQKRVKKRADKLLGTMRCHSLHCGGIIIMDDAVPKDMLLKEYQIFRKNKDRIDETGQQIKMNKDEVEDAGMIKIDILSNRGLGLLWDVSDTPIEDYPQGDKKVFDMLGRGDNLGVVYGESRAMRKIFMMMKPTTVEGIAEALALIRPAATKNHQKSEFLKDYSPIMDLEMRQNYIIYDDDAIEYIQRLLKCSDSLADMFRKAFAKRDWKLKKKFVSLLKLANPQMSEEDVKLISDQLERLEQYSFCKSHAFSYAYMVYALAYLKVHHPREFWLAALNHCNSSYRRWVHFREARCAGVQIAFGRAPWKVIDEKSWKLQGRPVIGRKNNIKSSYGIDGNGELKDGQKFKLRLKRIDNGERMIEDFKKYGYWLEKDFLPGMYQRRETLTRCAYYEKFGRKMTSRSKKDPNEELVIAYFKGIVATGRGYTADKVMENGSLLRKGGRKITFLTIGWDNGKYLDLVLWGTYKIPGIMAIEGSGIVKGGSKDGGGECEWVEVVKWKFANL
jgi:DNA polymerase III alpha subunit